MLWTLKLDSNENPEAETLKIYWSRERVEMKAYQIGAFLGDLELVSRLFAENSGCSIEKRCSWCWVAIYDSTASS